MYQRNRVYDTAAMAPIHIGVAVMMVDVFGIRCPQVVQNGMASEVLCTSNWHVTWLTLSSISQKTSYL